MSKPTNEALREEIAEIYRERSVMDLTKADEIINKVLDAFEKGLDECALYHDRVFLKDDEVKETINNLRPGQ